jgi:trehalose synthase
MENNIEKQVMKKGSGTPLEDGTLYSRGRGIAPFSVPSLDDYAAIVGEERIRKLEKLAERLSGLKILEINSTAVGGGVAEMLYSQVPFLNRLGIEDEWWVLQGNEQFFGMTKTVHNLLQGKEGKLSPDMTQVYLKTLRENADIYRQNYERYKPDVVIAHDPQPLGLARHLKGGGDKWVWRVHIDMEEEAFEANPALWDFVNSGGCLYDAAIFSGAHYVVYRWPFVKYIVPPFIDPLSPKNREMSFDEISKVLEKYGLDADIPLLVQVGRFDPWKGIDLSVKAYKQVRKEEKCQLVIAGNMAADDPEGEKIFERICEETKDESGIHLLRLPDDVNENALEVNALQRAARVILQPSTKEGFGLVVTEAMWKRKPVITREVGSIPLQIKGGETGFFVNSAKKAAKRIVYLLQEKREAEMVGNKAHDYVKKCFLMPDRVADYLRIADYLVNGKLSDDSIISFYPWFRLTRRKTGVCYRR